jgi:N-sulfoglucosamine sulfohydrolase
LGGPHCEISEPSRTYRADEVKIPGCLPDLPEIRRLFAAYCTSVRRLDDMVGAVLRALSEAQLADNTIVVFLSDNGMAFPFAKVNCYVNSTRTPWIVRWPGHVEEGVIDRTHMISAVDLQPTILEAVGLPPQHPADGRSFLPLLKGQPQADREYVFTQYHHVHGRSPHPMRSVMTTRSIYIFNPWSNGKRRYLWRPSGFKAMQTAAESDPQIAQRVRHFVYRTVEEFYDLQTDPHCLHNLLADGPSGAKRTEAHDDRIAHLRTKMREWMLCFKDPARAAFDDRDRPEALEQFMKEYTNRSTKEVEDLKPYEKAKGYIF